MRMIQLALSLVALSTILPSMAARGQQPACPMPIRLLSNSNGSMLPTLTTQSLLAVQCWPQAILGSGVLPGTVNLEHLKPAVKRGSIVAFWVHDDAIFVKRVVGLPGDRVQMIQGVLQINGQAVERHPAGDCNEINNDGIQLIQKRFLEKLPDSIIKFYVCKATDQGEANNTPEYTVPPETVFVLGDNRDNSLDSRFMRYIGFVPIRNLVGIVLQPYP